jgi:hypothetical protein
MKNPIYKLLQISDAIGIIEDGTMYYRGESIHLLRLDSGESIKNNKDKINVVGFILDVKELTEEQIKNNGIDFAVGKSGICDYDDLTEFGRDKCDAYVLAYKDILKLLSPLHEIKEK